MARVTYVHHYYPALYFAILCAGFCLDWSTRALRRGVQWGIYAVLAISFGMEGSHTQWRHLKWLDSWRITD
ncbi:hypothetical protein LTR28_014024 [Elasticomyces elasticus]|nr:hypothetical protein LTR28_014024 [Elasticomyces elasticus]